MWRFDKVRSRLKADAVVNGAPKALLAPQVSLRRFHRNVTQQELDLLQLSACRVAQARAGPTAIVGRELLNSSALCTGSHNVPDDLFGDAVAPNRALAAHAPKDSPIPDACRLSPFVDCCLDPNRGQARYGHAGPCPSNRPGPSVPPAAGYREVGAWQPRPGANRSREEWQGSPDRAGPSASVRPAPATGSCTDPRSANFPSAHRVSLRL